MNKIQIYCNDEIRDVLRNYAEQANISMSAAVKIIIAEKLKK